MVMRLPEISEFVFDGDQTERLDKFLVINFESLTRTRLQKLIEDGSVMVNGKTVTKSGYKLEPDDTVSLTISEPIPTTVEAEDIPLDILFENDHVLIVNKPAGMVVHPSFGHQSGTLINAVLGHAPEMIGIAGEGRPGVVHRLDKDTSGIILLAKDDPTMLWLQSQFKHRSLRKIYTALVDRHPPTPEGIVEAAIARDPSHRLRMAVVSKDKGREAQTDYRTLKVFSDYSLLEVHPLTGRTHQIRVHLSFIGCPIAGDTLYGYKHSSIGINRHFLHASQITISLAESEKPQTFQAPLPAELEKVISNLK